MPRPMSRRQFLVSSGVVGATAMLAGATACSPHKLVAAGKKTPLADGAGILVLAWLAARAVRGFWPALITGASTGIGVANTEALTPTERYSISVTPHPQEVRLAAHEAGLSANQANSVAFAARTV